VDYNPKHPAGLDKRVWNKRAVRLVEDVRLRVREVKLDAMIVHKHWIKVLQNLVH
jgi:hypothetical protein